MMTFCSVRDYIQKKEPIPLIDVRSPGEYASGHIPGALNIPLFSDKERAHVGTIYKKENPQKAREIGMKYVEPKLEAFISEAMHISPKHIPIAIHCWRGGQRSQAFGQHLSDNGFSDVSVIEGGYKAFRRNALSALAQAENLIILGGYTGSGKTHILHELAAMGEQIIDLEGLASHKGSAFGKINMNAQPTNEQFVNDLYTAWNQLDHSQRIWVEDESMRIGQIRIPIEFHTQMRASTTLFIDMEKELRAQNLVIDYEQDCDVELQEAISRITRKLGGQNAQEAVSLIKEGNYKEAAVICLRYYDRMYGKGLDRKESPVIRINLEEIDPLKNAKTILEFMSNQNKSSTVKLTQYSHGAGCGCKIAPGVLSQILQSNISYPDNKNLLVGNDSRDDAAVYDLGDGSAIISTTDFFMPIVDDPETFGRIAATNAISDIYAMGGKPLLAIAILGWPIDKLPPEVAQKVIEGGRKACMNAGIMLAGGHSIDSPEPIFGLAVTGRVDIDKLKKNSTAKAGCCLYLTKPLGVGALSTAQKKGILRKEDENIAADNMMKLNDIGLQLAEIAGIEAMTDVTGFGLLGHLVEMCEGSQLTATIDHSKVPIIVEAMDYIKQGSVPGGTHRNWDSYGHHVNLAREEDKLILCDPQTSGGLLIAVSEDAQEAVETLLKENEMPFQSFGKLESQGEFLIEVK